MKINLRIFAGFFIQMLIGNFVFAQSKAPEDSLPSYAQIVPKFSEMVDHVNTLPTGIYQISGGQIPASSQINADGSVKVSRIGEIVVPAEIPNVMKIKRENSLKSFKKKPVKK